MSKGSAPTPPNPIATAGAQTSSNVSTAIANAFLNNTNQVTPLGSLSYDPTDTFSWTDPTTSQTYNIPRFTATQKLTPQEQLIQDQSQAAKGNLAGLSAEQSARLSGLLSSPFSMAGAPGAADPNLLFSGNSPYPYIGDVGSQQQGFGPYAASPGLDFGGDQFGIQQYINNIGPQSGFGAAGDITRSYGPQDNFSADRGRVEEALYGRINPQLQIEQQHIEQQLADQGIRYGSAAYTAAMDSYNRQANDARLAVTQTAGQEQQRMMDMAAKQAGFQNAAQQQAYQQELGRGTFANQATAQNVAQQIQAGQFSNAAQQQAYQQALGRGQYAQAAQQQAYEQALGTGTFANQAQQNAFSQAALRAQFGNAAAAQQLAQAQAYNAAQNTGRNQYLSEQYGLRNQPLNEITGLLSGSQIAQPGFMQTPQNQIPTTDIAGLLNQNFNQQFGIFQNQQSQFNQILGGLFGAAGKVGQAAIMSPTFLSDRRSKKDIHRVGTVFASTRHAVAEPDDAKKLPIYDYAYKDDPASMRHIGPMAQDVERIDPGAVREIGGRKHINPQRVMGSILRAA